MRSPPRCRRLKGISSPTRHVPPADPTTASAPTPPASGTPERPVRVLAPGFYTWKNKGDVALIQAFEQWLAEAYGAADVTFTSFQPEDDEERLGLPMIDMATRPRRPLHRWTARIADRLGPARLLLVGGRLAGFAGVAVLLRAWARLHRRSPRLAARLAPHHLQVLATLIDRADVVVAVPGGYLNAPKVTDDWWLFHLATLLLARELGKPPVLGPCSLGPYAGVHASIARQVLSRCDAILLREARSAEILRQIGVPARLVHETPDMAFRFDAEPLSADGDEALARVRALAADGPLIGVSVRPHHYPGHRDGPAMQRRYLEALAAAVGGVAERDGARIVVVPQTGSDLLIGRELGRLLGPGALVLEDDLSPSDLQAIYAELRLLVGTRMHANILALGVGVPVVGIAYEPKTAGILEQLGLGDWAIPIDAVDAGRLERLVRERWDDAAAGAVRAASAAADARARLRDAAELMRR
ncbi:polysaccharide pyruvyl transferase family protein [Patulibacter sp. NPDC049589]|uniref:polysaccharide pyruvyl transferase family protein n=1 Tax=Patulibacter sp. NPDC049589 TaxID=3154731 RepID=UPI00344777CC